MNTYTGYSSLSEAINKLREEGYTTDFNLKENCFTCNGSDYEPGDVEIARVYRFEGPSDPADEATLYALEAVDGQKGILVTGYGANMPSHEVRLLKDLKYKQEN